MIALPFDGITNKSTKYLAQILIQGFSTYGTFSGFAVTYVKYAWYISWNIMCTEFNVHQL